MAQLNPVRSVNLEDLFPCPGQSSNMELESLPEGRMTHNKEVDSEELLENVQRQQQESENEVAELMRKASTGPNVVISQLDVRGKGRRLTFMMQQVPDVLVKGTGDQFIEGCRELVGTDILTEKDESDDEAWTPKEVEAEMEKLEEEPTEQQLEESLTAQLLAANEETDALRRLDSLSGQTFGEQIGKEGIKKEEPPEPVEAPPDETEATENLEERSTMDVLQLRLWFMHVRQSYKKGVKVIKVDRRGQKFVRVVKIQNEFIYLSRPSAPRRCHLSAVQSVKLGFTSESFRNLLNLTSENEPVPPPQNCVVVVLPNQSISMILPSEEARNEFLLLMRVEVCQAKRLYGDNSLVGSVPEVVI